MSEPIARAMTEEQRQEMRAEDRELLERADRAFASFESFFSEPVSEHRAFVGPADDLRKRWEILRQARDELGNKLALTLRERKTLELAIQFTRPALATHDGRAGDLPVKVGRVFPQWNDFKAVAPLLLQAIGRVDFPNRSGGHQLQAGAGEERYGGTGFLVGPGLLLTCYHVIEDLGINVHRFQRGDAVVHFQDEIGGLPRAEDTGTLVRAINWSDDVNGHDLVLLEVELRGRRHPLNLAAAVAKKTSIVAIGYPTARRMDDQEKDLLKKLMEGPLGVRRTAPGEVLDLQGGTLYHDCTTLGGNSGSPLVSMRTGEVVGVHQHGKFMDKYWGVDANTVREFLRGRGVV